MAEYFNAKDILPAELIAEVMTHIPPQSKSGAILYFREDYYAMRNAEISRLFQIYESDPTFGSHMEIYEALSEHYGLTVRRICEIVKGVRASGNGAGKARRRYSGMRVRRSSRRMRVRTGAP
jgi:hypothetical protein